MGDTFSIDPQPAALSEVAGFRSGAASCGLRPGGADIGVLLCDNPEGTGSAVFTKNAVRAAPVRVSSPRATTGLLRAVIVNAGNANCYTGEEGLQTAREMVELAATGVDVPQERVIVASTGATGRELPMDQVRKAIEEACRDAQEGGRGDFGGAVASADSACKIASASGTIEGKAFRVAGAARDVSAAAPDVSTMFAFLVTDLAVSSECLHEVLISTFERTFDRLIVGGGMGTNDTLCILTSGRAGNEIIDNVFSADVFAEALEAVARRLIADAVPGGEPATSPIEIRVSGAASEREAEQALRAVAQSILVRTAIRNGDPNWGLILAAAGRVLPRLDDSRATVRLAGEVVFEKGQPVDPVPEGLKEKLRGTGVMIELDLGLGGQSAVAWAHGVSGGDQEELQRARRAAKEAAAAAELAEKERAAVEAERETASKESTNLSKRLEAAERATEEAKGAAELAEKERAAVEAEREAASQESTKLSKRLEAAERAAGEAKAAAAAERKALEEKLQQTESDRTAAAGEVEKLRVELDRSAEEAKAALEATRQGLEAKLKESQAARETASGESKDLTERLKAAEEAAKTADAESEANRKALEEQLKEKESAQATAAREAEGLRTEIKKTGDNARATIVAKRGEFEAKLKEIEAARENASGASKDLAGRLKAAERATEEARAASSAECKDLEAKLKETDSARMAAAKETEGLRKQLEKAAEEAKAAADAERKALEAKLKEAEAAREAASRESTELNKRLEAAQVAERKKIEAVSKKAEASARETGDLRDRLKVALQAAKEAKDAAKRAEKGAEAAAKGTGEAEAERKELEAKFKEAAKAAEVIDILKAELIRKDTEVAEMVEREEIGISEARRYWEEGKKVSSRLATVEDEAKEVKEQLSLKDQLVKQLKGEEKKHEGQVRKLEKQLDKLKSKLDASGGKNKKKK